VTLLGKEWDRSTPQSSAGLGRQVGEDGGEKREIEPDWSIIQLY